MIKRIGLGGGCHWCTEAVFASLRGVISVQQGWIASIGENDAYSEAVIVEYDSGCIPLKTLIAVHLCTHSATSQHSMRTKYRSAVYYFEEAEIAEINSAMQELQPEFDKPLITQVLQFWGFMENIEEQLNYYYTDPGRPFCETYINPKLKLLLEKFRDVANTDKLRDL
ncbi:MAG: peptide-methionine (S)-S-oxide reductase [Flavobacterium sp.]